MLQSVRSLSFSVAFNPDFPLIFPHSSISSPLDVLCYSFSNLEVLVYADEIYNTYPLELPWKSSVSNSGDSEPDDSSGEEDESDEFEPDSSDTESDGSSVDWEVESEEFPIAVEWEAVMDLLQ